MKKTIMYLLLLTITPLVIACEKTSKKPDGNFDVQFELPALVETTKGGEYTFIVKDGKSPQSTDLFILESGAGISYVCPISQTSTESFTVRLANECVAGEYIAYIKRDAYKKSYGRLFLAIIKDIGFIPDEGTTIYGIVSADDVGVGNVVVSDGLEVAVTNEKGIYQLKSAKKRGYVFMSIPGGYEVQSEGVLPQFHHTLKAAPNVIEQANFSLIKVNNQDSYKVFMLGDMHLANRTNDNKQFSAFTSDLTQYMNRHKGEKMYAIALGDMTWDIYWYSNTFYFPQYLNAINTQIKDLQIFHVTGNHDKDFKAKSDFDASIKYMNYVAPTYYSFNIGKIHYVVMDDINCDNYDGTESRNYVKKLSNEQLDWLEKDLSHVDKNTPLIVAMHAQVFYPTSYGFKIDHDITSTQKMFDILDGREVHFVSGHTHMIFNVIPESTIVGGRNFYEHNSGSVCASWWWSDYLTAGVHISVDGSPGGYGVWDVSSTDMKRLYKSTGWSEDYQFRSYDLNNVSFSMNDVPLMPSSTPAATKKVFQQYIDAYPTNSNHEVLINIWNWNPKWTLSVVDEDGEILAPTGVWAYDPLHIAALSVKRFNKADLKSTPSFVTEKCTHFFKVTAKNTDVDLMITVKDEFGNTWTENMQRPKAFSTDVYINNN